MRYFVLAALLILGPLAAAAFEVEERKRFEANGPEAEVLKIISTADLEIFAPLITGFQAAAPGVAIEYTVASSAELMKAIHDEGGAFDLAISSAMDLQTKLANDGLARTYVSEATARLPDWARWRDQVIAFTQEPAVVILSEAAFAGLPTPENRGELTALLRANPERFDGMVGTYDIRTSGLGYLFATQDSRNSESFWPLMETFGRLNARLYCCSSTMITDVLEGRLAVAYNVLGSYADRRLETASGVVKVLPSDFTSLMLRSAIIPVTAANPDAAGHFLDFLVDTSSRATPDSQRALPPIGEAGFEGREALRPIALGPELLVFLDRMRRDNFLTVWSRSIEQQN